MPGNGAVAQSRDVVYQYDGGLMGFYCCVFASMSGKVMPMDILSPNAAEPTLFEEVWIETDTQKADRVRRSVAEKISPQARELIENVFLSCLPQKELHMLRFLYKAYRVGPKIMQMLGDVDVAPLLAAQKHLFGERHLLLGFIRFSDYGGALAATITPKNFVLPYLAGHFINRFSGENFLIYDKTHGAALIYEDRKKSIVPVEGMDFPTVSEEEEKYQSLWKQFYKTIAIEARENPKCRMTHMPKRYWENMTEMQEFL